MRLFDSFLFALPRPRWRYWTTFGWLVGMMVLVGTVGARAQTGGTSGSVTLFLPLVGKMLPWRPFSDTSLWNTRLPASPEIDPNSPALIARFASYQDHKPRIWLNINRAAVGMWATDASTPRYTVQCPPGNCDDFVDVAIPLDAVPDPESDGHMMVVDATRSTAWDFYRARREANGAWSAAGGAIWDLRSEGIRNYNGTATRGSGFPLAAGLIYWDEIKAGVIRHALVMAYGVAHPCYVWPAKWGPGHNNDPNNTLPFGARLQLDPTLDLNTLNLSPAGKVIARALQEYGMYMGDQGADSIVLIAESFYGKPQNPWATVLGEKDLYNIPADRFRVLKLPQYECNY